MKSKERLIEINKLKMGHNDLVFSLNDSFLKEMGSTEPMECEVKANVSIKRAEHLLELACRFDGTVILTCDICLDPLRLPLKNEFGLLIRLSETEKYDDDEIVYITPLTIDYDLSQFLFDNLMLSIPPRKTCSMGGKECNSLVLEKMEKLKHEHDDETEVDPRWEKLKDIINPN